MIPSFFRRIRGGGWKCWKAQNLPYKKGVYFRENCEREQISVVAEGLRRMRQRKKAVEALQSSHDEQHLWKCVVVFQGYRFKTISGLPFSYKIKTGRNGELTKELWIDRRESSKSLTWSSVLLALGNIKGEVVDRPKALGDIRGVTYIFGMFYRFGLIDVPDEVKEKMKHPKQNTGKQWKIQLLCIELWGNIHPNQGAECIAHG